MATKEKKKTEEKKQQASDNSTSSNVKSRLTDAYASVKPEVNTYEDGASLSVGGNRVGGVTAHTNSDGQKYYGVYVDNTGNPYRGVMDKSINTPLGSIDYGYDGDTSSIGYTNPYSVGSYNDTNGQGVYLDKNGQSVGELYANNWGDGNVAYGGAINTPIQGQYYNEINLPTGGMIGYGNDNGRLSADYTPAQNSLQARLLNALIRRRQ